MDWKLTNGGSELYFKNMNHLISTSYLNFTAFAFLSISYSVTKTRTLYCLCKQPYRTLPYLQDITRNGSSPRFVTSPGFSFAIRNVFWRKEKKLMDFVERGWRVSLPSGRTLPPNPAQSKISLLSKFLYQLRAWKMESWCLFKCF